MKTLLLILVLALAGCATPHRLETPSGKPEVMINSADRDAIRAMVLSRMLDKGWTLEQESGSLLQFSLKVSDATNLTYQLLLGGGAAPTPDHVVKYTIVLANQQTRLMAQVFMRTRNRMGGEELMEGETEEHQKALMDTLSGIKTRVEAKQ